jgi:hypothetical protein
MLLPRREWKSEGVLLAHVHSVFMEIASKAFLYFHVLCVGSGSASGAMRGESLQAMCERKQAQKLAFMRQIDAVGSDVSIVENLAEGVKQQHEAEHAQSAHQGAMGGFAAVSSIKLDHTVCTRFANTKGPFFATSNGAAAGGRGRSASRGSTGSASLFSTLLQSNKEQSKPPKSPLKPK